MSLNGLDDPKVKEAHDAAAAEPGGWFLLKYASRDEIEVLERGNGGIVELRNSIAQYEEASPLFGFLRYRRRNVIIKYLPEDCSRLVQARMTVHFNAVCERLSPYDTTFEIQTAKELKDTKLSAACSLHAASGSASSSNSSLRRRRLMEIAEEEEEEQRATKRQSTVDEEDRPATSGDRAASPSHQSPASPDPPVTLNSKLASSPDATKFAVSNEPPSFVGVPRPPSPAKSLDTANLSQRPDLYSYSSYTYGKPKVKLGPRPSLDVGGRPRTSTGSYRPVANLPAGFKMFSKGSRKGKSEKTKDRDMDDANSIKEVGPEITFLATSIPIPEDSTMSSVFQRPHTSGARPATSSGVSIKSGIPSFNAHSKLGITPEKARLMKAMQLREKKKKMSMQPPTVPVVETSRPSADKAGVERPEESAEPPEPEKVSEEHTIIEHSVDKDLALSKADSGIDVASGLAVDRASLDTQTDSHPPSPLAMSSEVGESTNASSISESTDETIQAKSDCRDDALDVISSSDEEAEEPENLGLGQDLDVSAVKRMSEIPEGPEDDDSEEEVEAIPIIAEQAAKEEEVQLGVDEVEKAEKIEKVEEFEEFEEIEEVEGIEDIEESPSATADGVEPPTQTVAALPLSKFADVDTSLRYKQQSSQAAAALIAPEASEADVIPSGLQIPTSKFSTDEPSAGQSPTIHSMLASDSPDLFVSPDAVSENTRQGRTSVDNKRFKRRPDLEPIRTDVDHNSDRDALRSEAHLSDDEDLMDELQTATVQEAKPILVAKTPMGSNFPHHSPPQHGSESLQPPRIVRTVSNPIRGPLLVPGDVSTSSARSVSTGAAYLHQITRQPSASLSIKKTNVASGISQRIKALEMLTGNPADGQRAERPSSAFFAVRKPSGREPSRSPSVVDRATSLSRHETPSPPQSRGRASPVDTSRLELRSRSGSMASRLSVFEGGMAPRGRPESVQVTARIVRDHNQPFPKLSDQRPNTADFAQLELKQSHLVVDHQRGSSIGGMFSTSAHIVPTVVERQGTPRRETIQERREKRRSQSQDGASDTREEEESPRPRRRSSLSIVKDFIKDRRGSILGAKSPSTDNLNVMASPGPGRSPSRPPSVHTTAGLARRLSISSRRSSFSKDREAATPLPTPLSPSLMTEAGGSGDESKSSPNELGHKTASGGKSRASRFMRRLSSSLSSSRKTMTPAISPTVAEEEEFNSIPPSSSQGSGAGPANCPTIVAYLGDVNVQFPDNLLWKRRTMCLDSQGFLILSAVQGVTATTTAAAAAGAIKRYHLSDFRQPYTPEMEMQELPHSVCLDFVDGSGLQIACEDRAGQLNVLHVLQDAHQSHTSFGQ